MMNVFECALSDQFNNDAADVLWLHNTYGEPEEMPVEVFFRAPDDMPEMELYALSLCKGKVLDVGAGVGSHALALQRAGLDVTALDISKTACDIGKLRGLSQVINLDILRHKGPKYDTILMLMNGIGLAGRLEKLPALLEHCKLLLNTGGQIIFDSSDISYLYEDVPFPESRYFGELSYKYQYKGTSGDWFDWLYVDKQTLEICAAKSGFKFQLLMEDDMDQYLGRLTL